MRAVLPCAVAVLVLASAASQSSGALIVPTAGDERFGWDEGFSGSVFASWDVFSTTTNATPELGSFGTDVDTSTVTETTGMAFLTGGGNIYNASVATTLSVVVPTTSLSGTNTRFVAQVGTFGSVLDISSLLLNGQSASIAGLTEEMLVSSGFGAAFDNEYMAIWDIGSAPESEYTLTFSGAGPHMSLEAVRIDAFASDTAFVTPASVTAVPEPASIGSMLALTCGGGIRWLRRRKSSIDAKRS
ncbi:PEP-CTERM sorting domain-containing protein [Crateriforma spongiae]|uniref:PEP-CTERM sorting domain-containing protein n=1 Tax=Crateriforma spongiae TaxID=2724528 RepID=UPI0014467516|nr:PEP-CTERM sorting domain-containing protein [Crateriforma spongiae]